MRKHRTWLPLAGVMLVGAAAIASADGIDACGKTSRDALVSCQLQARADYWLSVAKCENLPTAEERRACKLAAGMEREAALQECQEQFEARDVACDLLGSAPYHPSIDPNNFCPVVDNPYFPLTPGTTFVYEGVTQEGVEHVEVFVTHETRQILGVTCVEVRDTVELNGEVVEDTLDWFAQDCEGNLWYFGENVKDYQDGLIVSLAGSWTAGVDGAQPGIFMLAQPAVHDSYRQEFYVGEAEDIAVVLSLTETAVVPYGSFSDCLKTRDFTPLEPGVVERKYYAAGVGQVLTVKADTGDRLELVDIRHE